MLRSNKIIQEYEKLFLIYFLKCQILYNSVEEYYKILKFIIFVSIYLP